MGFRSTLFQFFLPPQCPCCEKFTETVHGYDGANLWPSLALDTEGKAHISYFDYYSLIPSEDNFNLNYATNKTGDWITETVMGMEVQENSLPLPWTQMGRRI